MTYNEWRDELKNNLLSVSEEERKRVLDYYAEAYADRRDAGFSENGIIEEFGAPYDAAKRILCENFDGLQSKYSNVIKEKLSQQNTGDFSDRPRHMHGENKFQANNTQGVNPINNTVQIKKINRKLLIALICLAIFFPPTWAIIGCVITLMALCVALPAALIIGGIGAEIQSIILFIDGNFTYGLYDSGCGLIAMGVGLLSIRVFEKLSLYILKTLKKFFKYIKALFASEEGVI